MSKPSILAMPKVHPLYLQALNAHYEVHTCDPESEPQWQALAPHIVGLAGGGESVIPGALLAQLPALKVVSIFGVGYDGVDVATALARGVPVTHTPGVLTDDVADLALGLVLSVARQIPLADQHVRQGLWPQGALPLGRKVSGARMGIVGLGRIGQAIARRGALGFGMKVIYHNRSRLSVELEAECKARYVSKDHLLAQADHLMLVLPYSAASHHAIGAAELAQMKPTATLVNIARGGIVDDAALAVALKNRTIAAAGLDVFEGEPMVHPGLLDVPNVVLTPHIGSATLPTRLAMAGLAADNLLAFFSGQPLLTPLNPDPRTP